jgi:hypothetical protein
LLTDASKLSPQQITHALNALTDWLGNDDPLAFLHSLQQGQLFNLLGEIAPPIAQWLSDNIGATGPAGRQSRKGGYSNVRNVSGGLSGLLSLASGLYPYVRTYLGGSIAGGTGGSPGFTGTEPQSGYVPSSGPSTFYESPNTLVIPSR